MAIPKNYYSTVDVKKLGIDEIGRIATIVDSIKDKQPIKIPFTLTAGDTTVTIETEALTETSFIDVGTEIFGINPTNMEIDDGDIVLTFEAQASDLDGCVMIFN